MDIQIQNGQRMVKIDRKQIREKTQRILEALEGYDSEVSILFVNNKKIRKLNNDYRKIDKPTDVLSFSQQEGDFNNMNKNLLGDVVISAEYAMSESIKRKISFDAELDALLTHGILHLFGYDHEQSAKEKKIMEKKEREILSYISKAPSDPRNSLNLVNCLRE